MPQVGFIYKKNPFLSCSLSSHYCYILSLKRRQIPHFLSAVFSTLLNNIWQSVLVLVLQLVAFALFCNLSLCKAKIFQFLKDFGIKTSRAFRVRYITYFPNFYFAVTELMPCFSLQISTLSIFFMQSHS